MTIWSRVAWTEAGQILAILDDDDGMGIEATAQAPKRYFDSLIETGALDRAVAYLGVALPRLEAIQWAWSSLQATRQTQESAWRTRLREGIAHWLRDPSDEMRRSLWTIATEQDRSCPEKLLASAIFFSGGSIAPEDVAPVPPPPSVCGKLASCAILALAHGSGEIEAVLRGALASGDRIAREGFKQS